MSQPETIPASPGGIHRLKLYYERNERSIVVLSFVKILVALAASIAPPAHELKLARWKPVAIEGFAADNADVRRFGDGGVEGHC